MLMWFELAGFPRMSSQFNKRFFIVGLIYSSGGVHLARDFRKHVSKCRRQMALLRGCRDLAGIEDFNEARKRFNELLHSWEVF